MLMLLQVLILRYNISEPLGWWMVVLESKFDLTGHELCFAPTRTYDLFTICGAAVQQCRDVAVTIPIS